MFGPRRAPTAPGGISGNKGPASRLPIKGLPSWAPPGSFVSGGVSVHPGESDKNAWGTAYGRHRQGVAVAQLGFFELEFGNGRGMERAGTTGSRHSKSKIPKKTFLNFHGPRLKTPRWSVSLSRDVGGVVPGKEAGGQGGVTLRSCEAGRRRPRENFGALRRKARPCQSKECSSSSSRPQTIRLQSAS